MRPVPTRNQAPVRRPASASRVEMTTIIIPEDTNIHGNVFGGRVMEIIDKAAAIAALRHCRTHIVTASVDSLDFIHPVKLGDILNLVAQVNSAWQASMEVGVKVWSEDPLDGARQHTCTAYLTTVAIDAAGRPAPGVPAVLAESADEKRRQQDAERRRAHRLGRVAARRERHRSESAPAT